MERLRTVLLALNPGVPANAPVPSWIYVFKDHRALEPYLPREDGKPANTSGIFYSDYVCNYGTMSAAWNEDPREGVYHSYIYDFMHTNFPEQPLWYLIGVAGYYSSFRTEGTEAHLGKIPGDDLEELRGGGFWIPLDRVFAMKRDSPEYRDSRKKSLFFAESWAFIHYCIHGNPDRKPQLGRFLALLRQGRSQDDAFREAFGADYATVFDELQAYIRNNKRYFFNRLKFAELRPPTEARVRPMTRDEVLVRLGDLLVRTGDDRFPDAERYYEAVLAENPANAGALGGLAALRQGQEKTEEAAALRRKAIEAGSTDYRVYYADGRARWEEAAETPYNARDPEARAGMEAMRAAFRKSIELNPNFAEAHAALGRTYLVEPKDFSLQEGVASLEIAHSALPSREDVARDLARIYDRKGDVARAEAVRKASGVPKTKDTEPEWAGAAGFQARVAEINRLLEEKKVDEAIVVLDQLIAESSGEVKTEMERQRAKLVETAASNKKVAELNRSVDEYNAAIALYNNRDYRRALAAFEKVAAQSSDPDVAKAARDKARELSRLLAKANPPKP